MSNLSPEQQTELEAAAFRRLIPSIWTRRKDAQNIDLMILAGFCRNCLSKWYKAAADERDLDVSMDDAREKVYKMTYEHWKAEHQLDATTVQLAAMAALND